MSASREKKTRLDLPDQNLTEKQKKALKEEREATRKRITYIIVGIVCAAAAAALLIWNSGFFQGRSTAVTIGDHDYTAADIEYYYQNIRYQYYYYAQYGASDFDKDTDPADQIYDESTGQTYHDYFLNYAIDSLTYYTALVDAAKEAGYTTLSEDSLAKLDDSITEMETSAASSNYSTTSYLRTQYGPYMSLSKFKSILEMQYLANEYYATYQDTLSFTDDELDSYYTENAGSLDSFVYNVCLIDGAAETATGTDGTAVAATDEETAAAMAEAKTLADTFADRLGDGEDFEALAQEYTAGYETPTINLNYTMTGIQVSSLYSEWMLSADRVPGDTTVVESSSQGYFVVEYLDHYLLTDDTANIRQITVSPETDEGADAPTAEQMEAAKAKAEQLLATWKSGEATEDTFATLATDNSSDTNSASNGGLFKNVYVGEMFDEFNDWVFDPARKAGDTTIVENTVSGTEGYQILYFIDTDIPLWKVTATNTLTSNRMTEWTDGLKANYEAVWETGIKYVNA